MWKRSLIRRSYPLPAGKPGPRLSSWAFPVPRFTLRMAATLIDWALLALAASGLFTARDLLETNGLVLAVPSQTWAELAVLSVLFFLYFGCYRFFGTTPGKALFHLRLERAGTRARVGMGRAWLREVVLKILPITLVALLSQLPAIRVWLPGAYVLVPCFPVLQALLVGFFRSDGRQLADLLLDTRVVGASRTGPYARWVGAFTSSRSLAFQACLGLALVTARYAEQARWMVAEPNALYERYRPAIVRIEVSRLGTPVATGTGFFISEDGVLVTNDHVLAPALRPGMGATFLLADGRRIDRFRIGACSDERNIDLCVAKLDVRPDRWLSPKPGPVKIGDEALLIGHPLSFDFSLSQGIVSGLRQEKRSRQGNYRVGAQALPISSIQFTAPVSPGNSGGPVFNRYGELLGVVTSAFFLPETAGLNFGISQEEVFRYAKRIEGWRDPRIESDLILGEHRTEESRLQKLVFQPAMRSLAEGRGLDPMYFRHLTMDQSYRKYGLWLPRDVMAPAPGDGCRRSARGTGSTLVCPDYRSDGKIQIDIDQAPKGELAYVATIVRPSAFLPYWRWMGIGSRGNHVQEDRGQPRAEAFRCERIRFPGLGGPATLCTQVAYNVPYLNSVTSLVVAQREEDGVLIGAFGVSDSDALRARQFQGAQVAVRSFEFEGFLDIGLKAARSVASEDSRLVPRPSPR